MAISKDLFLSILSMDAYNRGYGAGISDPDADGGTGLGVTDDETTYYLGTAKIEKDSAVLVDGDGKSVHEAAGFYAVAYTVGEGVKGLDAGTTVISYRGTRRRDARSAGRPFGHATAARAQSGMCRNMMQPCGRRIG